MIHPFRVLARQLQFTGGEVPSRQTVWGAHFLSECMDGDGVTTAWLWKTLKGAVILCSSVSLSTLKCTVIEMYHYFSRAAFTYCEMWENLLLSSS